MWRSALKSAACLVALASPCIAFAQSADPSDPWSCGNEPKLWRLPRKPWVPDLSSTKTFTPVVSAIDRFDGAPLAICGGADGRRPLGGLDKKGLTFARTGHLPECWCGNCPGCGGGVKWPFPLNPRKPLMPDSHMPVVEAFAVSAVMAQLPGDETLFRFDEQSPLTWLRWSYNHDLSPVSSTLSHLKSIVEPRAIVGKGRVLTDSPGLIVDSPDGWELIKKNPGIAPWVHAATDQL
jgi:hypothetical protein